MDVDDEQGVCAELERKKDAQLQVGHQLCE